MTVNELIMLLKAIKQENGGKDSTITITQIRELFKQSKGD